MFVAAIRNRKIPLPVRAEDLHEVHDKEAEQNEILQRTDQFRYFCCIDITKIWNPLINFKALIDEKYLKRKKIYAGF